MQFLFKWSNIFIAGPHLSGLEFRGQRVTVGKEAFFIGTTIVFEVEGISSQAKEKNMQINGMGFCFSKIVLTYCDKKMF